MTWNESATYTPRHCAQPSLIREFEIEAGRAMTVTRERNWARLEPRLGRHSHPYSETAESLGGRHRKPSHRAEVAR